MNIDILTLFPKMFAGPFNESIIKRAQEKGLLTIKTHNLRDWTIDKHHTVDDSPYGGGAGMVMKVDVIDRAIASLKFKSKNSNLKSKVILLTPQGRIFTQKKAKSLSQLSNLILICGHYEGFDERVRYLVDEQISIGDYILTGGEIPAMVLVDAIGRLIPGVLAKGQSHQIESFSMGGFLKDKLTNSYKLKTDSYLEFPQYTRPEKYLPISKRYQKPLSVPKILLGGNHQKIYQWQAEQSYKKTLRSYLPHPPGQPPQSGSKFIIK